MKLINILPAAMLSLAISVALSGCIKEQQQVFPLPIITFSNDYNATSYFQTSRVYQDTTVIMPNKVYMTASCSSLAGIDETEVSLNGVRVHYRKEQFQEFNREIDTLYKPVQTAHTEDWIFKVKDLQNRVATREIKIQIK